MSTDSIEKLYRNFGILADAKDKLIQHEKEYLEILTAVKGSPKEKRLASQFIARFFKHFPKLADQAIDAHLDLCEDEDMAIRKQAIKDLPALCKDNKEHTARIADILAQLLQAEDPSELAVVHNSIMSLMKSDPKGTLSGFFSQIISGDDGTRERCIKFLAIKLKAIGHDIITKEPEDLLIVECKKVLQVIYYDFYKHTNIEQWNRLVQCIKHALPFFSSQIDSSKFVSYICVQVLPHLSLMTSPDGRDIQLELLKLLAELTVFCGTIEKPEDKVQQLYNTLITYMPLPPATEITDVPKLQFSHVECLMYAFHKLCKQTPEFLIKDAEQLKEFRLRLQYFARGIQGYIKKLREAISGKTEEELKSEENQLKVVALKTTNNINTLIKDLFHSPPSFKSIIHLSWKTPCNDKKSDKNSAQKRHTPITFGNDNSPNKRNKEDKNSKREIYTPPSGKYSSTISNYGRGRFKGNRPRGRGGFRTRGRGSWRKNFY
ncbi:PREDICTED: LOW QUALITY PROTEIN: apoptosis inhibitor 5 [Acromyrmex echinatior]|uniref:LOW QUALITY PROTEIN: apoptosis inhibitor 5 n=1 Tax=Acromyrmex echinatior TaxID=103372 RepID=UPI000580D63E|nr:PREDICTED: LOW QUALITY PROTEIN: apoptosis inhibitor 5 [Acromyrmex echinatior]